MTEIDVKKLARSPFVQRLHHGEIVHRFRFQVVTLWNIATEDLFRSGLKGLLPLVPFTREGRMYRNVERAMETLAPYDDRQNRELLTTLYGFGALVYKDSNYLDKLIERYRMLEDIFRESIIAQDFIAQGREQGRAQGREQGKTLRNAELLLKVVR